MKYLIYQHFSESPGLRPNKRRIFQTGVKSIERYAKNIGVEYKLTTQNYLKGWDAVWDVFRLLEDDYYEQYDKIVYLDADVIARDTTRNIFELYDGFIAQNHLLHAKARTRPEFKLYGEKFLNSGILLWDKETLCKMKNYPTEKLRETYRRVKPGRDQLALNVLAYETLGGFEGFKITDACFLTELPEDETTSDIIFVHLAGHQREVYLNDEKRWSEFFNVG